ncbi:hypothetical protein KACHI17_10830 [Sediminibacterium sp. KACHI17]|jgi:hypothetical protein|uniref:DUF5683 domain-containing protein n=1 Tax=Sediminibacterium sp. KACHI17 TaxID=1751071 RepID=A0AAT9GHP8_9BACT
MSVFRLFILSLLTCFTVSTLSAQSDKEQLANTQLIGRDTSVVIKDSTQKKNVAKKHIPRIATNRSWLIPGWGQAYNKQYWKIPVVYGILAIPSVAFVYNNNMYKKTKFAYEALFKAQLPQPDSTDYRLIDPQLRGLSISSVQSYRNAFRRDRDYSILWFVLAWGLQVADATVFAHLKEFDVSDDLTMQISPTFNPQTRTPGFGLVMSLKNPDKKPRQVR